MEAAGIEPASEECEGEASTRVSQDLVLASGDSPERDSLDASPLSFPVRTLGRDSSGSRLLALIPDRRQSRVSVHGYLGRVSVLVIGGYSPSRSLTRTRKDLDARPRFCSLSRNRSPPLGKMILAQPAYQGLRDW